VGRGATALRHYADEGVTMRTMIGCAAVLFALAAGAAADDTIDAGKLLGKWEPKGAKKDAKIVLEFAKGGKLVVTSPGPERESRLEGTYKLDGNKLTLHLKVGDQEVKDTVTVTKLTDDEMEGESDGKKGKQSFTRVKPK